MNWPSRGSRLGLVALALCAAATLSLVAPAVRAQGGGQAEKDFAFAQGLYGQENYQLAADKFAEFIKTYPTHANLSLALFRAGECLCRVSKFADAIPFLTQLTKQFPDSTEAEPGWMLLGDACFQAKQYEQAAAAYAAMLAKFPKSDQAGRASYWLGESYYHLEKHEQAIAAYQQALGGKLDEQEAAYSRYAIGWTYLHLNQADKAIPYLQQVLDKHPASPVAAESQYLIGTAYKTQGNYPAALDAFGKVLAKYGDTKFAAYAQAGLAWAQFEQKAYEPALAAFKAVVDKYPDSPAAAEARLRTADCLFHLRRWADAAPIYEQVSADQNSKWAEEALYWLAVTSEQLGDAPKALTLHTRLVTDHKQSPHLADSYLHIGRLQTAAGKVDLALAAYKAAADATTDPALKQQALAGVAWARYAKDKTGDALADLEKLVRQDPKSPLALELGYQVAYAHVEAARYQPALDLLTTVEAANAGGGGLAGLHYLAGVCYDKLGDSAKAEAAFRSVLAEGDKSGYYGHASAGLVGLCARKGDLEQAQKIVTDLEKSQSGPEVKAFALYEVAEALYQAKRYAEAGSAYQKAVDVAPDGDAAPFAQLGLSWVKLSTDDPAAADAFLAVAQKYPASPAAKKVPEGLLAVGEKLFTAGKYPEAQALYQRILDGFPDSALVGDVRYKLGWALLKQGKPDDALPSFTQAAAKASLPAVAADARYQAARLLAGKGDYQQAAGLLEPFKAQYQDSDRAPAALVLLGRADLELKQEAPATEVYNLVLTRYPDHACACEAQVGLARLYRQQKAYDKALDALAKALKTATGAVGAEAQYELGCTYRDRGETKTAAEEFLKVAILYADDRFGARAQFEAGQCYEKLGDTASALKTYKVVLRDYPKQQQVLDLAQARVKALEH